MRMVVGAAVLAACAIASGCSAGMQYAMENYKGTEAVPFAIEGDDVYRVFDKPQDNRLMITPSLAKITAAGAISGATLRTVDVVGHKSKFEGAALAYLKSTGRTCRAVSTELIERPQWEVKYDCSAGGRR